MSAPTPAIVLGGTGYVAGELLRLIAGHPQLEVAAVLSDSQPGAPVADAFAHLRSAYPDLKFAAPDELHAVIGRSPVSALFSAAPHGVSAAIVDRLLSAAESAGTRVHCVDISADFRYASQAAYEAVYKHTHFAVTERAHDDVAANHFGHAPARQFQRVVVGLVGENFNHQHQAFFAGYLRRDAQFMRQAAGLRH